jgi:hypothetical protein
MKMLARWFLVSALVAAGACQGSASGQHPDGGNGAADGAAPDGSAGTPDAATDAIMATDASAGTADTANDATTASDATAPDAAADASASAPFALFVTQSPPGPQNGDRATWSGVLQFLVSGDGAPFVPGPGIDKAMLADPVGLAYRAQSHELFVANRHGNDAADGIAGSISRFLYDASTSALTANGTITGNGLSGVHQLAFDPATGELFAANVVGGVSRFTFDAAGAAQPNGIIANGTTRGVAVSPDGKNLYVTTASNFIRHFKLPGAVETDPFNVPSPGGMHFMRFGQKGDLYAAALENQLIYEFTLSASGELAPRLSVMAASPASVAFSADGREMLTSGHRNSALIERFQLIGSTWTPAGSVDAQASLGDLLVIPGN